MRVTLIIYHSAVSPAPLCIAGLRVPRDNDDPPRRAQATKGTSSRHPGHHVTGDSTSRRGREKCPFGARSTERREEPRCTVGRKSPAGIRRLCSTRRRAHSRVDNSTGIDQRTVEPRGRDQSHVLARVTGRDRGRRRRADSGRAGGCKSEQAIARRKFHECTGRFRFNSRARC